MLHEDFYKKGYNILNFNSCGVENTLKEILDGKLKEGFNLQQKYSSTLDLRPSAIDYSDAFLNILKKNDIKNVIRSLTLRDLTLYHIQVRTSNSTTSYMDWHRDTYYDNGQQRGMAPPGIKIIYYPTFLEEQEPRLLVAEGSHRTMLDNRRQDLTLVNMLPKKAVFAKNDQALLFDTSVLHAVVPDKQDHPSIRLIYSFLAKEQIPKESNDLHNKTSKMYEDLF